IGVPPETIKDVMELRLDVPVAYVLPRDLFDRRRGLSVAEFEFPAYYNFFLLKRRCRLVVLSQDIERRVRAVFPESLFRPSVGPLASEFADGYPESLRPDFKKESDYFRTVPGKGRLAVDDLVEFIVAEVDAPSPGASVRTATAQIDGQVSLVYTSDSIVVR